MPCSSRSRNSPIRRLSSLSLSRSASTRSADSPRSRFRLFASSLSRSSLATYWLVMITAPSGPSPSSSCVSSPSCAPFSTLSSGCSISVGVGVSCGEYWIGAAAGCSSTPASALCLLGLRYLLIVVSSPLSGSVIYRRASGPRFFRRILCASWLPRLVLAQKEYYGYHPPEGVHSPVAKVFQHAVGRELNEVSPSGVPLEAYLRQKDRSRR